MYNASSTAFASIYLFADWFMFVIAFFSLLIVFWLMIRIIGWPIKLFWRSVTNKLK
jgi:hypothetical protein